MRALLLALAVLLASCTRAEWRIDADFTPDERAEIVSGIEEWSTATDSPITWEVSRSKPNVIRYQLVYGCGASVGRAIALYPDPELPCGSRLRSLTIHEIGHQYGVGHDTPADSCVSQRAVGKACQVLDCGPDAKGTCDDD